MSDLISRKALINKLEQWQKQDGYDNEEWNLLVDVITEIKDMPPATDIYVGTKDGTDCISRQAAINALDECYCGGEDSCGEPWIYQENAVEAIQMIEPIPPAQPYTIHSDGRLWITVDDIDKVRAVVVDEHKSKFCKQFYEDYEDAQPEIVHCGECRHYVFVDDRMDVFPIRGCSVTGFRDVDGGDFCSRAERREVTT